MAQPLIKRNKSFWTYSTAFGAGLAAAAGFYLISALAAANGVAVDAGKGQAGNGAQVLADTTTKSGFKVVFGGGGGGGNPSPSPSASPSTPATPVPTPSGADPVIVAAGDIGKNGGGGQSRTGDLIRSMSGLSAVLALGDLAYDNGTSGDFSSNYQPFWGSFKSITKPTPGNHEYNSGGGGYYAYWNNIAKWYAFDIGSWRIYSLNSQEDHSSGSPQDTWLKSDLAAHTNKCTLAYTHYPRFSSDDQHGDDSSLAPLWQRMIAANGDIFLAGHAHTYERFNPQDASGTADAAKGLASWVVGTGGADFYTAAGEANTAVKINGSYGVLKLTLHPSGYDYAFVDVGGKVSDAGTGNCH